jgi:hypothetical protein
VSAGEFTRLRHLPDEDDRSSVGIDVVEHPLCGVGNRRARVLDRTRSDGVISRRERSDGGLATVSNRPL